MAELVLSTQFRIPLCLHMDACEIETFCIRQDEFVLETITAMRDAALNNLRGSEDKKKPFLRSVKVLKQVLSMRSAHESDLSLLGLASRLNR